MDTDPPPPPPPPPAKPLAPTFTPGQLLPVLAEINRYRILEQLIDGAPRSATELGRILGRGRMAAAKHLACLRTAGLVELCSHVRDRRTTCYRLVPAFVPPPGAPRTLDFGWCVLRFV